MKFRGTVKRTMLVAFVVVAAVATGSVIVSSPAEAAPTVSRAELIGGRLRVEGRAADRSRVTVTSTTAGESTAAAYADRRGSYRVEASGFVSSSCRVTVSDPTGSTTVALSGCTPSVPPPTTTTTAPPPTTTTAPPPTTTTTAPPPTTTTTAPPPTTTTQLASCTITPRSAATYHVGDLQTFFWTTTGCRTSTQTVQWSLVSGVIPPGMSGPFTQGVSSGYVTGKPTTVGTFTFTVRVRDQTGASDTETSTINVEPPRPITVTTQGFVSGRVGEFYCCGNLFADGGIPGYTWAIVGGAIPPGLSLDHSEDRITGTPTTEGTFTFTVQPTDSRGVVGEAKAFDLVVQPAA